MQGRLAGINIIRNDVRSSEKKFFLSFVFHKDAPNVLWMFIKGTKWWIEMSMYNSKCLQV